MSVTITACSEKKKEIEKSLAKAEFIYPFVVKTYGEGRVSY